MKRDEQDREDQRLAKHDPRQRVARLALSQFQRFSDQDDLAEDERLDDGEALLPDADPVPLQQLPVQAEERKKDPQIHTYDGVSLEFADGAFLQALLAADLG